MSGDEVRRFDYVSKILRVRQPCMMCRHMLGGELRWRVNAIQATHVQGVYADPRSSTMYVPVPVL